MPQSIEIPAVSLFTGSGGMDLGFDRAGFSVRVAVEMDPAACATLRANWQAPYPVIIERPLEDVTTDEILHTAGLSVGEVGLVLGGPPCQPWCVAGERLGFDDPRGLALFDFCRVVREAQPQVFCIENVPGFLYQGGTNMVEIISSAISEGGSAQYTLSAQVLNAAAYGVAQQRRRVFIVGWQGGGEFYFPSATHHVKGAPRRHGLPRARTVADAFRGLPEATPPSETAKRVASTIKKRNAEWYGKR